MQKRKHHVELINLPPDVSEDDLNKLIANNHSIVKAWIIEDEKRPRVILELSDGTMAGASAVAEVFDGHFWMGHKLQSAMILLGEDE